MNRPPENCVMCSRFQTKGHEEQAAQGNGWCTSWEKYVSWNGQAGVLFVRSRHENERLAFADKFKETA